MSSTPRLILQKRHTFQVASVAWAPDGMLLASGGAQQVSVWDARSGKTLYTYRSQTCAVVAVAWSHDGKRLACSGRNVQKFHPRLYERLRRIAIVVVEKASGGYLVDAVHRFLGDYGLTQGFVASSLGAGEPGYTTGCTHVGYIPSAAH